MSKIMFIATSIHDYSLLHAIISIDDFVLTSLISRAAFCVGWISLVIWLYFLWNNSCQS